MGGSINILQHSTVEVNLQYLTWGLVETFLFFVDAYKLRSKYGQIPCKELLNPLQKAITNLNKATCQVLQVD